MGKCCQNYILLVEMAFLLLAVTGLCAQQQSESNPLADGFQLLEPVMQRSVQTLENRRFCARKVAGGGLKPEGFFAEASPSTQEKHKKRVQSPTGSHMFPRAG